MQIEESRQLQIEIRKSISQQLKVIILHNVVVMEDYTKINELTNIVVMEH